MGSGWGSWCFSNKEGEALMQVFVLFPFITPKPLSFDQVPANHHHPQYLSTVSRTLTLLHAFVGQPFAKQLYVYTGRKPAQSLLKGLINSPFL